MRSRPTFLIARKQVRGCFRATSEPVRRGTFQGFGSARQTWVLNFTKEARVGTASFRILLVDDFAPWRQTVSSMLLAKPELQVVGEASDGAEAVEKAVELRPDLILLDIGMPTMNGIEAARQILRLVPESKIIFLSQESSDDVIQEALSTGASGYVVKTMAGKDLLTTLESVLSGEASVSR